MSERVVRNAALPVDEIAGAERIDGEVEPRYSPLDGGFYFQSLEGGDRMRTLKFWLQSLMLGRTILGRT